MVWQMEKSQKSDGEAAKNRAVPVVKEPPNESLEGILSTIDTLRVSGNLESALMILMDVLEKRYHKIGKEEKFENLIIKFLKCKISEFDDSPEITAYMQVKDITDKDNDKVFIFNDWTFSSSPSLRPFDHPVYDIWLTKCY